MNIKKILAGIDFGPATESVISYGAYFARHMGANLHLLYVIDYLMSPPAYLEPYIEKEKIFAEKRFDDLKKYLSGIGMEAEIEVTVGRLQEAFSANSKKHNIDLFVLGFATHRLRRSSSERLIKGFRIPMLVVRGKKAEEVRVDNLEIRKILCPVDFSDISRNALDIAKDLSEKFSSELQVIHTLSYKKYKRLIKKGKELEDIKNKLLEDTKVNLRNLLKEFEITATEIIKKGDPDKSIVSHAKEYNIDLIVMGARGLGFIREMLIGSVTDAVLKSSPCPVLVIH